ncbi:MAG: DnaA ATPase domain-containing protein [Parvularculaceae bacterium]
MTNATGGDLSHKFEKFRAALLSRHGKATFRSWFDDLAILEITDDSVTFETGSRIKSELLGQRYLPSLKQAWCAANGPVKKVYLKARPGLGAKMRAHAAKVDSLAQRDSFNGASSGAAAARKPDLFAVSRTGHGKGEKRVARLSALATPVDERNTFESLAVDETNELACAAARQIFAQNGSGELVYIYGPSGVGKTHLLHAVGNEWRKQRADGGIYLTYSNLVNGCVDAVLTNSVSALQRDILANGLVAMDDIHLLTNKNRTQEEVLNVIDAFLASGRQVIIAGEGSPSKLVAEHGVHKRLADRLAGGLSVCIAPGGAALRLEVLKKRLQASAPACSFDEEALEYVACNFTQSMRETIGALNQLVLVYGRKKMRVGLEQAKTTLKARLQDRRRVVSLADVMSAASEAFGVSIEELKSKARPQRIVRARHGFVFCGREVLKESFPRIGAALGRDHTTAMSSMNRAEALLERDKAFQQAVVLMREKLEE